MRELVVISGKGGTGKTSITASFAALADECVLVDADVDGANLHLLLQPTIQRRETFMSGHEAVIRQADCSACGACFDVCRFDAVLEEQQADGSFLYQIDPVACEGCGFCVSECPPEAIDFPEQLGGEWYVSRTRHGPMLHARLQPGGENAGKLVARLREEARMVARQTSRDLILIDGPPGIGCPVNAALTGVSLALIVTEPSLSGEHDLIRILELLRHFDIPAMVCVNKWDIEPDLAMRIEALSVAQGAQLAGRIRYDRAMDRAQRDGKSVVEIEPTDAGSDVRAMWCAVQEQLSGVLA